MIEREKQLFLGKKVFFLHPSALVQNQVISELIQEEFEIYVIKDTEKINKALIKYPDSVLIASINEGGMKDDAWLELMKGIQNKPETASVDIGIISASNDEALKKKYTDQLKVQCGYIVIKSDLITATKQIAAMLKVVNAKGRRKYLRFIIDKGANATVNVPLNGTYLNGVIKDISVVGFSCAFTDQHPVFKKNTLFGNMQLRLQSQLLKAEGIFMGSRMDDSEEVHVILFSQRTDSSMRAKIRKYIQTTLQSRMDEELK